MLFEYNSFFFTQTQFFSMEFRARLNGIHPLSGDNFFGYFLARLVIHATQVQSCPSFILGVELSVWAFNLFASYWLQSFLFAFIVNAKHDFKNTQPWNWKVD